MSQWRRKGFRYTEGESIAPSNMMKRNVESYAERVAKVVGFKVGQDPSDVIEHFGGRIHFQDYSEWEAEDGSIFVHDQQDFDVLLSRYTSALRDRFTVAHELGHYFLHSNQGRRRIVAHRQGTSRIEWEANWFAAGLLMPRRRFVEVCEETKSLSKIAAVFGVSEDAARVRRDAICPE